MMLLLESKKPPSWEDGFSWLLLVERLSRLLLALPCPTSPYQAQPNLTLPDHAMPQNL